VEVIVNGLSRGVPDGATVAWLIDALGLNARHVAVELNLEVVPRARHVEQLLSPGDRLEVVTLVGGG
jgi:thiamine biosynthesis protein ThiS